MNSEMCSPNYCLKMKNRAAKIWITLPRKVNKDQYRNSFALSYQVMSSQFTSHSSSALICASSFCYSCNSS